jgi:hypothetical protein
MALEGLVVLGIIPGTNIQVGFLGWAILFAVIAVVLYVIKHERRAQTLRFLLIRVSLTISIRRLQRA